MVMQPLLAQLCDCQLGGGSGLDPRLSLDHWIDGSPHVGQRLERCLARLGDGRLGMDTNGHAPLFPGDAPLGDENLRAGRGDPQTESGLAIVEHEPVTPIDREGGNGCLGQLRHDLSTWDAGSL
jgi:hypothetical protein